MVKFILFLGVLASLTANAGTDCAADMHQLYNDLYGHSAAAMKSLDSKTGYFYWGRARVALESTPNEKLEAIFKKMSKADLEETYWNIKSGVTKASKEEEAMVEELWHMVDDLGDQPFWGDVPDRGFAIREAMRAHDAKLEFSGDPAYAAQLTDQALAKTEMETIARALAEHKRNAKYPNSKWYDRVVRFFSPHHDKVEEVLETNNSLRERMQLMYRADEPALEAQAKYKESLKLTKDELGQIQGLASDTAGKLAGVRNEVADLYGREISMNKPLREADIRVRELAKKAKGLNSESRANELGLESERDMDVIDEVIGKAWNREKGVKTGMPLPEKHDTHLQIRNSQYRRETPERRAAYLGVTEPRSPKAADYNVETEWTVTVQHEEPKTRTVTKTVSDGNGGTKTETEIEHYTDYYSTSYGMSRTDVLKVRYEEALRNGVNPSDHMDDLPALPPAQTRGAYAVSASNGSPSIGSYDASRVNSILQQASNARARESEFRGQIAHATSLIDGITNESYKALKEKPAALKETLKAIEAEKAKLETMRADLASYQTTPSASIKSQWTNDVEKDFRDRNQQMVTRFDHMINRIDHLAEQVRRQTPALEIEYSLPDYAPQMAELKQIRDKNKKIIKTTAWTAGTAATAGTLIYNKDAIMSTINDLMESNRGY